MSTPPSSAAGAASMLRLPPSPETASMKPSITMLPPRHLSIRDEFDSPSRSSRLRSVARYGSFQPQAIACSIPLITNEENSSPQKARADTGRVKQDPSQQLRGGTSVAAIAGPQGVALFRVSRPHTPLVVLSHASSRNKSVAAVSALSFQPHTKDSLLLAAARGNGILVWDATGHSLSPLLGRLAMEPTLSSSDQITSISWKASSSQSLLASTNATTACLWDLRTSLRANSSRPSVRLGTSRNVGANGKVIDPLVRIAASSKNEVATLDATGTVHVFDVRMEDRSPGNIGEVSSFSACHHVGIGLEYLPSSSDDTRWITWGLDAPQTDAIVKVWSEASSATNMDTDSYWYMDGSPTTSPKTTTSKSVASNKSSQMQYRQIAEFSTPYLACARVCPDSFENNVVTVGMIPGRAGTGSTGWQAELWKLTDTDESSPVEGGHHGVEKMASFGVLNDDETTSMVGSKASLGSLRGAELALESSQGYHEVTDEGNGLDLLLCCLSDKGFVTAHTVLKAPSESADREAEKQADKQDSPRRERPLVYSERSGIFPSDGKIGLDAASMLRGIGDSEHIVGTDLDGVMHQGTPESPKAPNLEYFGSKEVPRPDDGTSTQFDMDVSVSYGAPMPGEGADAMDMVEVASPPLVLLTDEDNAVEIGLQRQKITEQIDKDRVPCPRLCGASFSPGLGGIVCFNNGEVRKMWYWYWYEKSDPRRRVNMSSGTASASKHRADSADSILRGDESGKEDSSMFSSKPKAPTRRQECPRTLQDLEDMTDHARFSQWRSDESSSGGESSIDDESDESLDGFASGDEAGGEMEARKRIYEKYFGVAKEKSGSSPSKQGDKGPGEDSTSPPRSPPRQKQAPLSEKSNDTAADGAFADLVPAVFITYDQDVLVFSGQSEELARGWMLGDWYIVDDQDEVESLSIHPIPERESSNSSFRDAAWGWNNQAVLPRPRSADQQLSSGKEMQMSPSRSVDLTRMQRIRSDPMLLQHVSGVQQVKSKYGVGSDDDPVHAGAYSKRPNRNESLVFLKKLVSHQRGDSQLQSLMSPPDSPLLPNKMPLGRRKRSTSSAKAALVAQTPSPTSVAVNEDNLGTSSLEPTPLGVYTLAEKREYPRRSRQCEEKLCDACDHNAEVCRSLGQMEKANVWSLLSQMAENVLKDECDSFNGWGGAYGGSLGHNLVSSFLDFYEAQGDVQMLATMVCVLGGGQWKRIAEGTSLLPASHQDRYDLYIRRYAEVLYGWRLMSIRAEVRKHLTQKLPAINPIGDDQYTAIDIVVWCSRCHKEADTDDGICRRCRNYALRCSLCDIAVRGLTTICASCGHGGHTSHLTEWFSKHSVCPTGCGCECVLVAMTQGGHPVGSTQPGVDKVLQEAPELLIAGAGQIPL